MDTVFVYPATLKYYVIPSVKNVRVSVRPSAGMSFRHRYVFRPILFKLCIRVDIGKEWFGIVDGQNGSSNKYRIMALD